MATKFRSEFVRLSDTFDPNEEVDRASQRGEVLKWPSVDCVRDRLNQALGFENWWTRFEPWGESAVKCSLGVRLRDGALVIEIIKEGIGVKPMPLEGDRPGDEEVAGADEAFLAAAEAFGVGSYLRRGPLPRREPKPDPGPMPQSSPRPPDPRKADSEPASHPLQDGAGKSSPKDFLHAGSFKPWLVAYTAWANAKFKKDCPDIAKSLTFLTEDMLVEHLKTALVDAGSLDAAIAEKTSTKEDVKTLMEGLGFIFDDDPQWFQDEALRLCKKRASVASKVKVGVPSNGKAAARK